MAEKKFVQREKRFEVGNIHNFEAVVLRDESDDTVFFAELLDFSRSGLKFRLPFSARFDEKLKIRLSCKNSDLEYLGIGRVRHIRNTDVNRWIVGCSIEPVLSDELIGFLASATQQERRRSPRLDVNAIGRLSRQGAIDETNAQVRNVSKGGFCLFVEEHHEPGSRVNLTLDNKIGYEEKISARVRWHKKMDDGHLLGLCYADNESYEKLIDCLDLPDEGNSIIMSMRWKMVAAAMVAMLLPALSYLLLGASFEARDGATKELGSLSTPQKISNPFVVEKDDSRINAVRPELENATDLAHDDEELPRELTTYADSVPRRLRERKPAEKQSARARQVSDATTLSNRKFELYSVQKKQEATSRRGNSSRKLLIPSEVIRKRLLH